MSRTMKVNDVKLPHFSKSPQKLSLSSSDIFRGGLGIKKNKKKV